MNVTYEEKIEILRKYSDVVQNVTGVYKSIFTSLSLKIHNEEYADSNRFPKIIVSKSIDYTGLYSLLFFDIENEIVICCLIHEDIDFSIDKLSRIIDSFIGVNTPNGIIRNIHYYTDSDNLYDFRNLSDEKILFYRQYKLAQLSSNDFLEKFKVDCSNLWELYSAILKAKRGENIK